jgi:hypothetical protein
MLQAITYGIRSKATIGTGVIGRREMNRNSINFKVITKACYFVTRK